MSSETAALPRVLVIGCGFGGLEAVRALAKVPVQVTLIDRTNHHLFQPLLYQVATAGLAAPAVSAPIRHVLRQEMRGGRLTVLQSEVSDINATGRTVTLQDGAMRPFDHLIVAAGATNHWFGHDDWAPHAPGLKTLADAFDIRARVVGAFERAELAMQAGDHALAEANLTFAVIGAGPTGVELAGTLVEIARHTLRREFRHIDTRAARVILVEGGERVLPSFVPELSASTAKQLQKLGVMVRTQNKVLAIDAQGLTINTPEGDQRLTSRTVLWAAGVAASPLAKVIASACAVALDRAGRVPVLPDLSVAGHPHISVVGDMAAATSRGQPVPGVSPAAKQMGRCAAANIAARTLSQPTQPFVYADYGALATIGRSSAVVQLQVPLLGRLCFSGLGAWLFWLFAHLYFLIGFRNRIVVLFDWGWSYFSFARHARVVAQANSARPGASKAAAPPGS